jgi:hypothetical protein
VGWLLDIWQITHDYVKAVVDVIYTNDAAVANDQDLQAWMDASGDPLQGNIRGLEDVQTRDELTNVLTSLLYRVNAHGGGTLTPSVHPVLSFVANFPPCLQKSDIPEPGTPVPDLLERLPHTGTCGGMTTFFYTFVYSLPNAPLIPSTGITTDPFFQPPDNPCNAALFKFRQDVETFMDTYVQDWNGALGWYLGNPPGSVPLYAQNQYGQWSLSIEL